MQFKGEYINGRRYSGKGYNYNGKEVFIIKEGKGHAKEYYFYGKLKWEGQYLNRKRNGKGKE